MIISLRIEDDKFDAFFADFSATLPIPLDGDDRPQYTPEEWVRVCAVNYLNIRRNIKINTDFETRMQQLIDEQKRQRPPRFDDVR